MEIWRNEKFGTPLPTGSAAPFADPEGDGLVNQIEYVTSTNPPALTGARPWHASGVADRLTFTFPATPPLRMPLSRCRVAIALVVHG